MMGDTPVKTGQNRQCIDNISDYDREHQRIFKSVHHRLDLGPNMLLGAQQQTTVESAVALKVQDKIEGKYNENMQSENGQYGNEMYKREENMIPQLDGTFNISDNSDSDSHSYLDLAGANIIPCRTRGQKDMMKMKGQILIGAQLSKIIQSPIQKSKYKDKRYQMMKILI